MTTKPHRTHLVRGTAIAIGAGALLATGLTPATSWSPVGVGGQFPSELAATGQQANKNSKVTFFVGLDRREKKARDLLKEVTNPDAPMYRGFPSRAVIRRDYGPKEGVVDAVRRSASKHGLSVSVDATGVFARVHGTAGQMGKWLGKPVMVQKVTPAEFIAEGMPGYEATIYTDKGKPPKDVRKYIPEFFGTDIRVQVPLTTGSLASTPPPYDGVNKGTPKDSCLTQSALLSSLTYSLNEIRTAYGLDSLPATPRVGKATRMVIISDGGDGFSKDAARAAANCFNRAPVQFRTLPVQGLNGPLPDTEGEADLDVQVAQAVLPKGSVVRVVQDLPIALYAFPTWATAFNLPKRPDVISYSYGACEPLIKKEFAKDPSAKWNIQVTDSVLLRLGLAGTSTFSSTGDVGSSGCVNQDDGFSGPRRLAVEYPASSKYMTAVGGTRIELTAENTRAEEYVWNSTSLNPNPPVIPGPNPSGGNGGHSIMFDRPWYQPKSYAHSAKRTVPDISAHAAPVPGWPVFIADPQTGEIEGLPYGGTSASTPFSAATFGLIAANERLDGRPSFGLIGPLLYNLHAGNPSTFYDVTKYNNDVFDKGCCKAKVGYDAASGLGAPNFKVIAKKIAKLN